MAENHFGARIQRQEEVPPRPPQGQPDVHVAGRAPQPFYDTSLDPPAERVTILVEVSRHSEGGAVLSPLPYPSTIPERERFTVEPFPRGSLMLGNVNGPGMAALLVPGVRMLLTLSPLNPSNAGQEVGRGETGETGIEVGF